MKEFRRYMVKDMDDGIRTTPGALKTKLVLMTLLLWFVYTVLYYMSEPLAITSKYIRTNMEWVKFCYPILMPLMIIYVSYQFQFSAIENQIPSFCKMFPERKNSGAAQNLKNSTQAIPSKTKVFDFFLTNVWFWKLHFIQKFYFIQKFATG